MLITHLLETGTFADYSLIRERNDARKLDSFAQTKCLKSGSFFILSMAYSASILGYAILLVSSNSLSLNWSESSMNGGAFIFTPLHASILNIKTSITIL